MFLKKHTNEHHALAMTQFFIYNYPNMTNI